MSNEALPAPNPTTPKPERDDCPSTPIVRMTAPEDTYWIRHLGLPFFFRHTPSKWVIRAVVYFGLAVAIGLLLFNLVVLPYVFNENITDGSGLLSQFYILAILISCVFAPLVSTFSLAGERATGTMEFLRLAPLSPTAIVLGKTFAPVFLMHLLSLLFLLIGILAGTVGIGTWTTFASLFESAALILFSALLMHAVGALLASLTSSFRGFAAVIGTMAITGGVHLVALPFAEEPGLTVLCCFSPWGVMDSVFWHGLSWRPAPPEFMGSLKLAVPYLIFIHVALAAVLFRAAARRLDSPMRTALSPLGHISLWVLLLFTCLGLSANYLNRTATSGWEAAAIFMGILGTALIGLLIFDHPHRRDVTLATACQRVSLGRPAGSSLRYLGHALFTVLMTLFAAVLLVVFISFANPLLPEDLGWVALLITLPPFLSAICCLLLEANQTYFASAVARGATSTAGIALLAGILIAGAIDVGYTLGTWRQCIYVSENRLRTLEDTGRHWGSYYGRMMERYPERMKLLTTKSKINEVEDFLQEWPITFFLWHHPMRSTTHLGLLFGFAIAVVGWRWRAYQLIRKEAVSAVGDLKETTKPGEGSTQDDSATATA